MSSQIFSQGIYHGLPTFPNIPDGQTAIVAGANGISGQYMLKALAANPKRWSKIYAFSRRPPQGFNAPQIKHIALDFLAGVENIKSVFDEHNIKADYVFFFAYKEVSGPNGELWGGQQQMYDENGKMLRDFVLALKDRPFKRIVLQTGAKHYGVHIGPVITPSRESDPRVLTIPNFYYAQEDILQELSKTQNFTWAVTRSSNIVGAVKGNFMNFSIALGLYFAIHKELGHPIVFPGTKFKWNSVEAFSSSLMNAYLAEYVALDEKCAKEAFNAANGDAPTWGRIFIDLADSFGVSIAKNQFKEPPPRPFKVTSELPAPIDPEIHAELELRNSLAQWAKEKEVIAAWEKMADRDGLDKEVFYKASWDFTDGVLSFQHLNIFDMNKVREYGFFGQVDTTKDLLHVFDEARQLRFLPPL